MLILLMTLPEGGLRSDCGHLRATGSFGMSSQAFWGENGFRLGQKNKWLGRIEIRKQWARRAFQMAFKVFTSHDYEAHNIFLETL